jgi:hypothetical protein
MRQATPKDETIDRRCTSAEDSGLEGSSTRPCPPRGQAACTNTAVAAAEIAVLALGWGLCKPWWPGPAIRPPDTATQRAPDLNGELMVDESAREMLGMANPTVFSAHAKAPRSILPP